MNPTDNFQETLASLLAERKELRSLCNDLSRFRLMGNREQVQETEGLISDLVTGPLTLTKYETVAPHFLAEAVQNLLSYLGSGVYYDDPASIWNYRESITPGVGVSWTPRLQERLTALCLPGLVYYGKTNNVSVFD
jgi:hypothetical protein